MDETPMKLKQKNLYRFQKTLSTKDTASHSATWSAVKEVLSLVNSITLSVSRFLNTSWPLKSYVQTPHMMVGKIYATIPRRFNGLGLFVVHSH